MFLDIINQNISLMKRLLPIISIVAGLLFVSCSKSLTDIGYKPAPIGTINATKAPVFYTDQSGSYYTTSMAATYTGPTYQYYNNPYTQNTNMGDINMDLLEKTAMKDCTSFIDKFYSRLLSQKFNAKQFSKKYKPSCIDQINNIVDSLALSGDKMGGWQVFTNKGFEPGMKYNITYDKEAWFIVSRRDNPDIHISVQMIVSDLNKKPLITGIRY